MLLASLKSSFIGTYTAGAMNIWKIQVNIDIKMSDTNPYAMTSMICSFFIAFVTPLF